MALPRSVDYSLPPQVPNLVRAQTSITRGIVPNDEIRAISQAFASTAGAVASDSAKAFTVTGYAGNFNRQTVRFELPTGQNPNVFMDPQETLVTFKLKYTLSQEAKGNDVGYGTGIHNLLLQGSASSFFEACRVYATNKEIESINRYSAIFHYNMWTNVMADEATGSFLAAGVEKDVLTGQGLIAKRLPVIGSGDDHKGEVSIEFAVPLMCILGLNSSGGKLIPWGAWPNVVVELDTVADLPFVFQPLRALTADTGAGDTDKRPVFSSSGFPRLTDFEFHCRLIDFGAYAQNIMASVQNRYTIKCVSYKSQQLTIPAKTTGSWDSLVQIKVASARAIVMQCSYNASTALGRSVTPIGNNESVNPGINYIQAQVELQYIPPRPLDPMRRPAEAFMEMMAAHGTNHVRGTGTSLKALRDFAICAVPVKATNDTAAVVKWGADRDMEVGTIVANGNTQGTSNTAMYNYRFFTSPADGTKTLGANFDKYDAAAHAYLSNVLNPSKFYASVNFQRVRSSLFSGLNTTASGIEMHLKFNGYLTEDATNSVGLQINILFIVPFDCVLYIDATTNESTLSM